MTTNKIKKGPYVNIADDNNYLPPKKVTKKIEKVVIINLGYIPTPEYHKTVLTIVKILFSSQNKPEQYPCAEKYYSRI